MIKKILIYLGLFSLLIAKGQNITFTASAPRVVDLNEEFQLVFSINSDPSGFKAPDLSAFEVLSGPNRSSSSNISIINGKMNQSVNISLSFILQPKSVGKFNIEGAKATVDGKSYTSTTLSIEVVNAGGGQQQNQQSQQSTQQNQSQHTTDVPDEKVFLKVIIDRSSLYKGEFITATVKLYSILNINDLGNLQLPKFNGVFSQEIEIPQIKLNRENLNGKVYITGVIKQYYLFPQQSGDIKIDPFSIEAVVAQPTGKRSRSPFDDFWGLEPETNYQWVKKTIKSKPIIINVKPLPQGAPSSFKGAVGSFTLKAEMDKNKVKTNDAITIKATINGTGNIKLVDPFELKIPVDFETYDPKTNLNIKGISGTKTFEYVMIPRHSGTYTIPSIEFSYFDSQTKQYKTLHTNDFNITVDKSADEQNGNNVIVSSNRDDVKFIGKDIRYIKESPVPSVQFSQWFFGSLKFYTSYGISLFLFLLFVIIKRKQIVENANIAKVRNKRANKQARKRLQIAAGCMKQNNKESFYEEILKALWGYLGDKFNILSSELSREKVMEILSSKNTKEDILKQLNGLLDECELARYALSAVSSNLKEIYDKTADLISQFENII